MAPASKCKLFFRFCSNQALRHPWISCIYLEYSWQGTGNIEMLEVQKDLQFLRLISRVLKWVAENA